MVPTATLDPRSGDLHVAWAENRGGEGRIVYDPNMAPHHHLVDEDSGRIYDLPWDALELTLNTPIDGFDVTTMEVVVRANPRVSRRP